MSMFFIFMGCFGSKSTDTTTGDTSTSDDLMYSTCDEAREAFEEYERTLKESLGAYKACTTSDECAGNNCRDICGISCHSFISNTENYEYIRDMLREFAADNCQACAGYEYEIYPEPEPPPVLCENEECGM